MSKIAWERNEDGDRFASESGISLRIYKAKSYGRTVFALGASRDGEDLFPEDIGLRWMRLSDCVERAQRLIYQEASEKD